MDATVISAIIAAVTALVVTLVTHAVQQRNVKEQEFKKIEELAVIDSALAAFVENIVRFAPPSRERDETVRACEALRSHLMRGFAPAGARARDS